MTKYASWSVWIIDNDAERARSRWYAGPPERRRHVIAVAGVPYWDRIAVVEGRR
jgi:hypothetical protein